ncbi:MAG: tetratricopeptide repeat protein [Microthrixaceae bacterium]
MNDPGGVAGDDRVGAEEPDQVDGVDEVLALLEEGRADEAVDVLEEAVRLLGSDPTTDPVEFLDLLGLLGRALTDAGRFDQARDVLGNVVEGRAALLGPDDPQTLVARGNLIRALARGGRPAEAVDLARDLLADRERLLGADHPSTLDTRGHLAQALAKAGRWDEAVDAFEALLEDRTRVLGADHPDVVTTRHNLTATRVRHPDTTDDDAIDLLFANLEDHRARFGNSDPRTLVAVGLLAEQAQYVGRHDVAAETLTGLVAARSAELGPDAAPTLLSRHMLAESLRVLGRYEQSVAMARAAADDAARAHGPAALVTLQARVQYVESLAGACLATDDPDPHVLDLLDGVLAALAATDLGHLEPDHPIRLEVEAVLRDTGSEDDGLSED